MSLKPGLTSTPMINNKATGGSCISPYDCLQGTLANIGYADSTNGHWRHKLTSYYLYYIKGLDGKKDQPDGPRSLRIWPSGGSAACLLAGGQPNT